MFFDWITWSVWSVGFVLLIIWTVQTIKEFRVLFSEQVKRKKESK